MSTYVFGGFCYAWCVLSILLFLLPLLLGWCSLHSELNRPFSNDAKEINDAMPPTTIGSMIGSRDGTNKFYGRRLANFCLFFRFFFIKINILVVFYKLKTTWPK
jgi:hypothetical protein